MACNYESSVPELAELIVIVIVIPSSLPPGSTAPPPPPTPTLVMSSLLYPPLGPAMRRQAAEAVPEVPCPDRSPSPPRVLRHFLPHTTAKYRDADHHESGGGWHRQSAVLVSRGPTCPRSPTHPLTGRRGGGVSTSNDCRNDGKHSLWHSGGRTDHDPRHRQAAAASATRGPPPSRRTRPRASKCCSPP